MDYIPLSSRRKKIVALRMYYRGGYSYYFNNLAERMLNADFTPKELADACIDTTMRDWLIIAVRKMKFSHRP